MEKMEKMPIDNLNLEMGVARAEHFQERLHSFAFLRTAREEICLSERVKLL